MNSVQVMTAVSGFMEIGAAAASRLNPGDSPKLAFSSFKERLDQANRKIENSSAGEAAEASPSAEVSSPGNPSLNEDEASGSDAVNAGPSTAGAGEKGQDRDNAASSEDASTGAMTDQVLAATDLLGAVAAAQAQNGMQPAVQEEAMAAAQIMPAVNVNLIEGEVNPVAAAGADLPTAGTAIPDAQPADKEAGAANLGNNLINMPGDPARQTEGMQIAGSDASEAAKYQAGVMTEQGETSSKVRQSQQDNSQSQLRQLLKAEGQRSSITRLNMQPAEASLDEQPDLSGSEDGQSSMGLNLAELTANKIPVRENAFAVAAGAREVVDVQDLMNQILQKAELILKQTSSAMTIQLKPEGLGKLIIKVLVDDSGTVTAHFTASSQQVKNMLEQNIQTLRQNLEAQGMKVDRAEVNVQLDSGGMLGDFGGRQQELWQQANARPFNSMNRAIGAEALESVLESDSSIYPAAYESGLSDDGFSFLV